MFKKIIFLFCLTFVSFPGNVFPANNPQKAVMIIASSNFRDEELLVPKDMLETNRVEVILASSSFSPARGMMGTVVRPEVLVEEINMDEYDAVIFVGGSGASEYWDDSFAHNIAVDAFSQSKVIGAICTASVTLARAGILKGKKATVWSGVAAELEDNGAIYTGSDVEVDGEIITANGPASAAKFAEELVKALVRKK